MKLGRFALVGALAAGMAAPTTGALGQNYPERPVTWLIAFGAGGGRDIWARTAGQMMIDQGLTDATFIYENRPGGSGVRALLDLINQYEGDEYILFPFQDVVLVPALEGAIEENYEDITVIGGIAMDRHFLVVQGESELQTVDDVVAASQDEQLVVGVGSSGRFPAQIFADASDFDGRLVRFEGDAEIVTALLGGHVDIAWANPSEVAGHLEAGSLRAIAVAGPERLGSFPDVPTFQEQGYDVSFGLFRGVGMPPGVSDEVKAYWTERFAQLTASEQWKTEYLDAYSLEGNFLPEAEFIEMIERDLLPVYQHVLSLDAQQ